MKKSYILCPYCGIEVSVSGSSMHVKNMHTDKYEEFKKNFAEIKKTAVVKESTTRKEVPKGPEPPKIEEKEKPPEPPKEPPKEAEKVKEGDGAPKKGESFLDGFNKWLDSPEL